MYTWVVRVWHAGPFSSRSIPGRPFWSALISAGGQSSGGLEFGVSGVNILVNCSMQVGTIGIPYDCCSVLLSLVGVAMVSKHV